VENVFLYYSYERAENANEQQLIQFKNANEQQLIQFKFD